MQKKQLLDAVPNSFSDGKDKGNEKKEIECDRLYKKVGQLQIEVDWLKKTGYQGSVSQRQSNVYAVMVRILVLACSVEMLKLPHIHTTGPWKAKLKMKKTCDL